MKRHVTKIVSIAATVTCAIAFSPVSQSQSKTSGPTDPQIVGIVETANAMDIDYAKLAMSKSKNKEVREFAEQMERDHSTLQKSVQGLASKLGVTPADSGTEASLKAESRGTKAKLDGLKGKAFNKAYIDNEIAFHKQVIDATNSVLIPNAKNQELKGALKQAVPLFQGHLEHAQNVAASLENSHASASGSSY